MRTKLNYCGKKQGSDKCGLQKHHLGPCELNYCRAEVPLFDVRSPNLKWEYKPCRWRALPGSTRCKIHTEK